MAIRDVLDMDDEKKAEKALPLPQSVRVGPRDGDTCHKLHKALEKLIKCIDGSTPLDFPACNSVLQDIARMFAPVDDSEEVPIKSYSAAGYTLDVLTRLRLKGSVADLHSLASAEDEAAKRAVELWRAHAGLPGDLADVERIVQRALELWNRCGDDTRKEMIAHLGILAEDYFDGRDKILEAVAAFLGSIRVRHKVLGDGTPETRTQLCMLVKLWFDLAKHCGSAPAFADDLSDRAGVILKALEDLNMLSHYPKMLEEFIKALERLKPALIGTAVDVQVKERLKAVANKLSEWHDRLERKQEAGNCAIIRKVQIGAQAFLHGRSGKLERSSRPKMRGADISVSFPSVNSPPMKARILDVCPESFRGVALDIRGLDCVTKPAERVVKSGKDHSWPVYAGGLRIGSHELASERVKLQVEFPDGTKLVQTSCDADVLRVWPKTDSQEGAGVVCYLEKKAAENSGWREFVSRQR